MPEYEAFLDIAMRAADVSRQILTEHRQKYLRGNYDFKTKNDASPVTETDERVEREIRSIISGAFPEHGMLGEEYGANAATAEYVWVIDPIDGTRQFIVGYPFYGTLIALCRNGIPVLGVVEMPVMAERWVGVKGRQSTVNGLPIQTRPHTDLATALVASSNTEFVFDSDRAAYNHLIASTKWRVYGGACYGYMSLAAGKIDLCFDSGIMREVDYCALVPIIEGAGGVMSDWDGNPLTMHSGMQVLACGDHRLHEQVLREIKAHR
ncbi:MAG: phosphatase [Desulfovibrio sp. MES5]|nr:MAG: phosphatase [Desulfovibrio sp. MES5]